MRHAFHTVHISPNSFGFVREVVRHLGDEGLLAVGETIFLISEANNIVSFSIEGIEGDIINL